MVKRVLPLLLVLLSPFAWAHNCPNVMKEIDASMSAGKGQALAPEKMARLKQLRADGEKLHKEGKHDDSMKALNEAKGMLGS